MTRDKVMGQLICSRGHVNLQTFRKGLLSPTEINYFSMAHDDFVGAPLYIDDTSAVSFAYVRNSCRALKQKGPLDLVWIDHLGKMRTDGAPNKYNRAQEVGWLTGNLKALAQELDVPVVLLCQLSRAVAARGEKEPILSDLRESGDIEQDADLVAFLHRAEYYNRTEDNKGKGDVIVAKQRQGPTGTCHCAYDAAITRWSDQSVYLGQEKMPWA
jgi:replicative DNA helicase